MPPSLGLARKCPGQWLEFASRRNCLPQKRSVTALGEKCPFRRHGRASVILVPSEQRCRPPVSGAYWLIHGVLSGQPSGEQRHIADNGH
jgi:hypothetical protein